MKSIVYYVKNETRTFKEYPFNEVDSLILSSISYYDFKDDVSKFKALIGRIRNSRITYIVYCFI